ncbi:metal-dependent phosphohydrolase [Dorcoceras hygrometricum]|uniref:Metal-dependent phosphohydrolase n=1 Tax=Dorcoceras hygrometricum TaxID=472368 RepID=A0A2Z7AS51_9LAMI|nr:metal-dependent phosphohydrolase [Dorcoceras hygrometricum]
MNYFLKIESLLTDLSVGHKVVAVEKSSDKVVLRARQASHRFSWLKSRSRNFLEAQIQKLTLAAERTHRLSQKLRSPAATLLKTTTHLDAFEIAHLLNSQRKAQNAAFPLTQTTPLLNASIAHLLISSKQYNAITISSKHHVTPTPSYLSAALKPSADLSHI